MRGRLQKLGILRESGHEHFNGSLVIPVITPAGEVAEMYGRKITPKLREGTPNHLYLKGEHRGVWNEEALAASKEIILCEALIDALDVLVRGLSQCDGELRRTRLHGGPSRGVREARNGAGLHRIRPRRGGQQSRREAGRGTDARWASSASAWSSRRAWTRTSTRVKVTPAAKSLGVLLNRAAWLGKGGKRAAVPVIVPEPESSHCQRKQKQQLKKKR